MEKMFVLKSSEWQISIIMKLTNATGTLGNLPRRDSGQYRLFFFFSSRGLPAFRDG
jgi:predicted membrane GTPase involved in stress response